MSGQLDSGWRHLRAGRWVQARACFESVLAHEETAEAFEGLSWAAWWLDEEATVFSARARAFRRYGESDDPRGAARMATWLAVDHLDFHGASAVASGWLQRARRLLNGLEAGPDHGWLAFHEGYLANAGGDTESAARLAQEAADIGVQCGVADLQMLGLALRGAVLVARAQVAEGMRALDEATVTALEGEAEIPISSAWTCCFLVSACTSVQDFDRAAEWCDRIAAFAERYGSRYMLAFCRAEYGVIQLWRGRWDEAEATLNAAVEDFSHSRPAWVGGSLATLAELRRRQRRPAEARELLTLGPPTRGARLVEARLLLDEGDAAAAADAVERLLRSPAAAQRLDRAQPLGLLVCALAACGRLAEAQAALAELESLEALAPSAPMRAGRAYAAATLAAARLEHDSARRLFEDAVDGFEASGAPFESAQARAGLAAALRALGRPEAAARAGEAAERGLRELATAGPSAGTLTAREREVLALLAAGRTNRQIAAELVISEHTVHRHVSNLLRKLELPSRTAAAAYAVRGGLTRR